MSDSLLAVEKIVQHLVNRDDKDKKFFNVVPLSSLYITMGVAQAGIALGKEFLKIADCYSEQELSDIPCREMSNREIILASRYAYREFAINTHDIFTRKAVNFKSNSFSIAGMTERAKEEQRIIWWCDGEIKYLLELFAKLGEEDEMGNAEGAMVGGHVQEMQIIDHVLRY